MEAQSDAQTRDLDAEEPLQAISRPFGELARRIVEGTPRNPERSTCLRKLREAKDCAVTATFFKS